MTLYKDAEKPVIWRKIDIVNIFAETKMWQKEHTGSKQNRGLYGESKIDCSCGRTKGCKLNCLAEHVQLIKESTFRV